MPLTETRVNFRFACRKANRPYPRDRPIPGISKFQVQAHCGQRPARHHTGQTQRATCRPTEPRVSFRFACCKANRPYPRHRPIPGTGALRPTASTASCRANVAGHMPPTEPRVNFRLARCKANLPFPGTGALRPTASTAFCRPTRRATCRSTEPCVNLRFAHRKANRPYHGTGAFPA